MKFKKPKPYYQMTEEERRADRRELKNTIEPEDATRKRIRILEEENIALRALNKALKEMVSVTNPYHNSLDQIFEKTFVDQKNLPGVN